MSVPVPVPELKLLDYEIGDCIVESPRWVFSGILDRGIS